MTEEAIQTLREFINAELRAPGHGVFASMAKGKANEALAALDRLVAERDSLRKALDDRYEADRKAAKAIFAETGRTSGFPSVREVVGFYVSEVERLEAQLPEGMKHCTILFKECEKGHGRLTATNWIDHGCPTCERDSLRAKLERAAGALRRADQFITNGIELGFIRMPDKDTPDTAHETPSLIRTIIAELRSVMK